MSRGIHTANEPAWRLQLYIFMNLLSVFGHVLVLSTPWLKLQYSGHLMGRANSLEKTLMLGKIEGRRRRGWQRMRWLDGITYSMDTSLRKLGDGEVRGSLVCCNPRGCRVGHGWTTEQQGSVVKNLLHCSRFWFDLWVGKISWRKCNPLKYSCLEDSMDRGAWWATVHEVAKELDIP